MVYLKSRGKTRTLMMRLFFISSLILHGLNWPWKIIISQKFFKISKWFYSTHFRQLHSLEQYQIRFRDAWYMGHVTGEFRISELFLGLNRGWNVKNGPKWFFWPLTDSPWDTSGISTKISTWLDHFRGFWFDCFSNSCAKTNYIF